MTKYGKITTDHVSFLQMQKLSSTVIKTMQVITINILNSARGNKTYSLLTDEKCSYLNFLAINGLKKF